MPRVKGEEVRDKAKLFSICDLYRFSNEDRSMCVGLTSGRRLPQCGNKLLSVSKTLEQPFYRTHNK